MSYILSKFILTTITEQTSLAVVPFNHQTPSKMVDLSSPEIQIVKKFLNDSQCGINVKPTMVHESSLNPSTVITTTTSTDQTTTGLHNVELGDQIDNNVQNDLNNNKHDQGDIILSQLIPFLLENLKKAAQTPTTLQVANVLPDSDTSDSDTTDDETDYDDNPYYEDDTDYEDYYYEKSKMRERRRLEKEEQKAAKAKLVSQSSTLLQQPTQTSTNQPAEFDYEAEKANLIEFFKENELTTILQNATTPTLLIEDVAKWVNQWSQLHTNPLINGKHVSLIQKQQLADSRIIRDETTAEFNRKHNVLIETQPNNVVFGDLAPIITYLYQHQHQHSQDLLNSSPLLQDNNVDNRDDHDIVDQNDKNKKSQKDAKKSENSEQTLNKATKLKAPSKLEDHQPHQQLCSLDSLNVMRLQYYDVRQNFQALALFSDLSQQTRYITQLNALKKAQPLEKVFPGQPPSILSSKHGLVHQIINFEFEHLQRLEFGDDGGEEDGDFDEDAELPNQEDGQNDDENESGDENEPNNDNNPQNNNDNDQNNDNHHQQQPVLQQHLSIHEALLLTPSDSLLKNNENNNHDDDDAVPQLRENKQTTIDDDDDDSGRESELSFISALNLIPTTNSQLQNQPNNDDNEDDDSRLSTTPMTLEQALSLAPKTPK
jgi:hypothetical protein